MPSTRRPRAYAAKAHAHGVACASFAHHPPGGAVGSRWRRCRTQRIPVCCLDQYTNSTLSATRQTDRINMGAVYNLRNVDITRRRDRRSSSAPACLYLTAEAAESHRGCWHRSHFSAPLRALSGSRHPRVSAGPFVVYSVSRSMRFSSRCNSSPISLSRRSRFCMLSSIIALMRPWLRKMKSASAAFLALAMRCSRS